MTRILHLSDLHFGHHRAALVAPLLDRINGARADLVVVTGDLTHRGRAGQYDQAAAFLGRITAPVMVVPGNHDVPLFNLPVRFLWPWAGWRRAIGPDLTSTRAARGARVLGLNSADPFAWQRGTIRPGEIGRILGGLDPLAMNIVALHHPLQQMPDVDKQRARRAPEALARFEAAGVRIVLSGHLHRWQAAGLLSMGHPRILQVQAGTALCDRESDRQNEFAVLEVAGDDLVIERHIAPRGETGFDDTILLRFQWRDDAWHALPAA